MQRAYRLAVIKRQAVRGGAGRRWREISVSIAIANINNGEKRSEYCGVRKRTANMASISSIYEISTQSGLWRCMAWRSDRWLAYRKRHGLSCRLRQRQEEETMLLIMATGMAWLKQNQR